jgi:hypothetical protein
VNSLDPIDRLYLDDTGAFNQNVDAISGTYMNALLDKRCGFLPFEFETSFD